MDAPVAVAATAAGAMVAGAAAALPRVARPKPGSAEGEVFALWCESRTTCAWEVRCAGST
jgi:hypothetical protein